MSFHDFKLSLIFLAGLCFASQAQAQNNVGIAKGITLGTNPVRAVVTPNGSEMYISNSGSNTGKHSEANQ